MNFLAKFLTAGCCILSPIGATAANADPTTLICDLHDDLWIESQPTTLDVNEAQGTVTVHTGGVHAPGGGFAPAHTYDPVPATFTDQEITFRFEDVEKSAPLSVINRITGSLVAFQGGLGTARYSCQAGHKQF
jgi:hypothetical protein